MEEVHDGWAGEPGAGAGAGSIGEYYPYVDPATNRITSLSYDGNGNVTFQPGMTGLYNYDVENRMTSAPGVQYGYDGQNKRNYMAAVNSNGAVTSEEFYFYGVDGTKPGGQ